MKYKGHVYYDRQTYPNDTYCSQCGDDLYRGRHITTSGYHHFCNNNCFKRWADMQGPIADGETQEGSFLDAIYILFYIGLGIMVASSIESTLWAILSVIGIVGLGAVLKEKLPVLGWLPPIISLILFLLF